MPNRSAAFVGAGYDAHSSPVAPGPAPEADAGRRWLAAVEQGDLSLAARLSDAVLAARDPATRDDPRLPYHLRWVWDGCPLASREVLVRCYHGLGDTLQFCRYLPLLVRSARRVAVEAQPELLPLLSALPGVAQWIPFDPARPAGPREADIEIMELMHAFPVVPDAVPYLAVPDSAPFRVELGEGLLVGLCWEAGGWDPARSLRLDELTAALQPSAGLVLLQRGPAAAQAVRPGAPAFRNPEDRSTDAWRTAGLLAACDLVVTVDTMVAHLAGALGRPALVLLKHEPDWRWGMKDCPWYSTLRTVRQPAPGDWAGTVRALLPLLRGTLAGAGGL